MAEESNFERYLQGLPVNEELARMLEETAEAEAPPKVIPAPERIRDVDRDLRRGERQELKEIVRGDAWKVVHRIQEKLEQNHQKCAISMSQDDPLQNGDRIVHEWAYVLMFRKAMSEFNLAIEAELARLENEDIGK